MVETLSGTAFYRGSGRLLKPRPARAFEQTEGRNRMTTPRLGRVSPNFTLSPAISFLPHLSENRNFLAGPPIEIPWLSSALEQSMRRARAFTVTPRYRGNDRIKVGREMRQVAVNRLLIQTTISSTRLE